MLRLLTIAALCTGSLLAHPHEEPSVEESKAVRESLAAAKKLVLYEGLPHPAKEAALFKTEASDKASITLADFHFYRKPLKTSPEITTQLKQALASPANLSEWKEKRCGGFHPDWSVSWRSGFRKKNHILICFGCQQVIYLTHDSQLRYDLKSKPFKELKELLTPLHRNRPKAR
ncbi:MAG: hypothetical protein AAGI48_12230 [Verrucomicrobiota bacterium]